MDTLVYIRFETKVWNWIRRDQRSTFFPVSVTTTAWFSATSTTSAGIQARSLSSIQTLLPFRRLIFDVWERMRCRNPRNLHRKGIKAKGMKVVRRRKWRERARATCGYLFSHLPAFLQTRNKWRSNKHEFFRYLCSLASTSFHGFGGLYTWRMPTGRVW